MVNTDTTQEDAMKIKTNTKAGGIATDPDSLNVIMATEF